MIHTRNSAIKYFFYLCSKHCQYTTVDKDNVDICHIYWRPHTRHFGDHILCILQKEKYSRWFLSSFYPPLPDYIGKIDMNGGIHEQIQKLPFLHEWEFPRERIKCSK